jgi:hypothetical protein
MEAGASIDHELRALLQTIIAWLDRDYAADTNRAELTNGRYLRRADCRKGRSNQRGA